MRRILSLIALMLTCTLTIMAQVTTSALSGMVTMQDTKEEVIGATVQAIHEPSGTKYAAVTNVNGRFTIQGMRSGGPYTVTISYIGYETKTYKDIGENISGTKNDVARAKWGGNWRMPTKAEMEELLSKCTHEMKEIKGKPVYVFYGKNKVSIAIPVDFFVEDGIGEIPVLTHYWTATHLKKGTSESLWIGPSESDGNDFEEVLGKDQCSACYIRPVCK